MPGQFPIRSETAVWLHAFPDELPDISCRQRAQVDMLGMLQINVGGDELCRFYGSTQQIAATRERLIAALVALPPLFDGDRNDRPKPTDHFASFGSTQRNGKVNRLTSACAVCYAAPKELHRFVVGATRS